jgi:hypothetical protein
LVALLQAEQLSADSAQLPDLGPDLRQPTCDKILSVLRGMGHGPSSPGWFRVNRRPFEIRDPTTISYCAETDKQGYDGQQALEGATGSAGRTESTSAGT